MASNPNSSTVDTVMAIVSDMDDDEQRELFDRLAEDHPLLASYAGMTAIVSAVEPVEPSEQSTDVFAMLTPEQQERATKLTGAMAEKFGVDEKDFSVLETKDGTKAVAYTAGNGIDLGDPTKTVDKKRSWNSIFDKKNAKNFMIEVDGKKVDTRAGMTSDVYDAMVDGAKARGDEFLPDSPQLSKSDENGQPWTLTLMTGEPESADEINAPIRDVSGDGRVYGLWVYRVNDIAHVRFRPAVVIE